MKWKRLLSPFVEGDIRFLSEEELESQIKNNLTVMNWMYLVLLIALTAGWHYNYGLLYILAILDLVFITSLHSSQKQNRIILEIRRKRENCKNRNGVE